METYQFLQEAYGEDAMGCAQMFGSVDLIGQTRHRSVAAATILTRSRTVWLFPIPKA